MNFFYYELKLWFKNIYVVFWALFFPLILVVILNTIYGKLNFSRNKNRCPCRFKI